jgi:MIP family channel proteins
MIVALVSGRSPPPVAPQPESARAVANATSVRALGDDEAIMATARRTREEEVIEERGAAAYTAEFLGTFVLVFFICMIVIVSSPKTAGATDWIVIGFVHFLTLMLLVAALGGTSGGHFNPAVTVTLTALRKISPPDAVIYILLQLAGGVAGALVAKAILKDEGNSLNYGAPAVSANTTDFGGFICELIGTFALLFAIMAAAVNPRAPRAVAPWVIGAALGLALMIFGPLTGGSFNPARAFGPDLVSGEFDGFGTFLFVYVLGPILGGMLAGTAYTAIVLRPQALTAGLDDVAVGPEGGLIIAPGEGLEHPGDRPIDKLE